MKAILYLHYVLCYIYDADVLQTLSTDFVSFLKACLTSSPSDRYDQLAVVSLLHYVMQNILFTATVTVFVFKHS